MSQPWPYPDHPGDAAGGYPNPVGYPPPQYGPPPGYRPGGYPGYPPPGYAPAGYGPSAFGGPAEPRFDLGEALSWALNKFGKNAAALLVPLLGYAVLLVIVAAPWLLALTRTPSADAPRTVPSEQLIIVALGYVAVMVTTMFVQAAYLSGCLDVADGKAVRIGSFFRPRNFGSALVTAVLVGLLVGLGSLLFVIPGLIVAFLTQFANAFAIDRSRSPIAAVKASFTTCQANIVGALLCWLAQAVVLLAGQALCGVGLVVAFPLAMLIQTYSYRRLSGGWVAPIVRT